MLLGCRYPAECVWDGRFMVRRNDVVLDAHAHAWFSGQEAEVDFSIEVWNVMTRGEGGGTDVPVHEPCARGTPLGVVARLISV